MSLTGDFPIKSASWGYVPPTDNTAGYAWSSDRTTWWPYVPGDYEQQRQREEAERYRQLAEFEAIRRAAVERALELQQKQPKKERSVRYLFRVTVVDPKKEDIVFEASVVAESREQALLKCDLPAAVRKSVEDYDILTVQVGQIRAKKDVQKVKVVSEE